MAFFSTLHTDTPPVKQNHKSLPIIIISYVAMYILNLVTMQAERTVLIMVHPAFLV